jgi:sterol desaturase/sphingolipid hydroxylase (fatty acid hydroxylase superfamily)
VYSRGKNLFFVRNTVEMDFKNSFGLVNGKVFGEPPLYVDRTKLPGLSEVPRTTCKEWLYRAPYILITSPNFVWCNIALMVYFFAPYNFISDAVVLQNPLSLDFLASRLQVWMPLVLGYNAFWHSSLYFYGLAKRPFIRERKYNLSKVLHNIVWTSSGVVIWTLFENIICYLWATGRLPYIHDTESFGGSFYGVSRLILSTMAIPLWRSFHFYFAHRFLHFKALYRQVHSLHHRNTDVEPFSGLCMHPVEHLYYYSCILPNLVFLCSPFAFVWNGVHLLLSPAASHSGYEDHFQSDAYHYMHHRYFECNYAGTDAAFLDVFFGTFRGSFLTNKADAEGATARDDAKSTLFAIPSWEFVSYLGSSIVVCSIWAVSPQISNPYVLSSLVGFGPVVLAVIHSSLFPSSPSVQGTQMSMVGTLFHILIGTLFCSLPISYMCWLALN